jgi:hypothetical protein
MIRGPVLFHVAGSLPDHDNLMLLWPIIVILLIASIAVVSALASRGVLGDDPERAVGVEGSMAAIAAALSFGAAAIHLAVVQSHLEEGIEFGAFFLVTGWFQMVWPLVYFLRRSDLVVVVGLAVNLVVPAIWLMTRTIGLPFGPTPWTPEPIGFPDLLATGLELGMVALLLPVALPDRDDSEPRRMPLKDAVILASFAMSTVALLSGYALLT